MRWAFFLLFLAIVPMTVSPLWGEERMGSVGLRDTIADDDDLACAHAPAGTVETVPPPASLWAVIVCAPESQALVPVEGMVWRDRRTMERVSILALPPGVTPVPKSGDYDPRYGVRFKALYAAEAHDAKKARLLSYLKSALGRDPMPPIDRVVQLDAVSSIYDMRYNVFFFIRGKRPRLALACIDQCRRALLMDVLTDAEAAPRTAGR